MAKSAKDHGRIANIGLVREHDFQDRNVLEDGCGNARDQEKDRGDEQEDDTDPVTLLLDRKICRGLV